MNWGNCYWIVGGDQTRAWSSFAAAFVPSTNTAFVAWLAAGNTPRTAATMDELRYIFAAQYPAGMLETYAADKRWKREVGGFTVNGMPVATDDRSKLMLMGARIEAATNPAFTTQWAVGGEVFPLDATQIMAISDAAREHVTSCFDIYATVIAGINAGTITTISAIDAAFAA